MFPPSRTRGWIVDHGSPRTRRQCESRDDRAVVVARVPPPGPSSWLLTTPLSRRLLALEPTARPRAAAAVVWTVAALVVIGVLEPADCSSSTAGGVGPLRMTMFDVGQGESILIETPSGGGCWSIPVALRSAVRSVLARVSSRRPCGPAASDHSMPIVDHAWRSRSPRRRRRCDHRLRSSSPCLDGGVRCLNHRPTQDVHDAATRLRIPIDLRRMGEIEMDGEVGCVCSILHRRTGSVVASATTIPSCSRSSIATSRCC